MPHVSKPTRPRRQLAVRLRLTALEDRSCPSGFTVIASGLDNPRGFAFGPDGQLYLAEGGPPSNTLSTAGDPSIQQVPQVGPYSGGYYSSIVRINPGTGHSDVVVSGLPSSQTSPGTGSLVSGVADVAFLGGTLYGIEAGAGASHGLLPADTKQSDPAYWDNTLFRVNADGSVTSVADLSAYVRANPTVHEDPADFEPDGTWYGMTVARGAFYATEPNHQEIDRVTPDGQISRVADMSVQHNPAQDNWAGPTAITYHGNFYVGSLGEFGPPHKPESVYKVTPSGQTAAMVNGLSEVLGVDFDAQGRMYVLESSTGGNAPIPFSGVVARVNDDGSLTTLADGLTFPTAMRFGPDGNLYVSNFGFGFPAGSGEIVRIDLPPAARVAVTSSHRAATLVSGEGLRVGPPAHGPATAAHQTHTRSPAAHPAHRGTAQPVTTVADLTPISIGVPAAAPAAAAIGLGDLGLDG